MPLAHRRWLAEGTSGVRDSESKGESFPPDLNFRQGPVGTILFGTRTSRVTNNYGSVFFGLMWVANIVTKCFTCSISCDLP